MSSPTEKVTLSLNRDLLEKMAKRSKKNLSQYVRDLIEREASMDQSDFKISEEIVELQGILKANNTTTKDRVHRTAIEKIRNYDR
jgi:uncharacterized protein YbcI